MILNSEKYHYMCIGKNCTDDIFLRKSKKFKISKEETIVGVVIVKKLNSDSHISRMCKKVVQKLFTISQISALINFNKRQNLFYIIIIF